MKKKHQADLPKCIYRNIENIAKSKMEKAKADLLAGAAWFSIRRYEYCKTPRGDKKQTRAVELEGVVFWIVQRITHHTSRLLHKPTAIYINLKYQKKRKMKTITAYHSRDVFLCTFEVWGHTVKHVWYIPISDKTWTLDHPRKR